MKRIFTPNYKLTRLTSVFAMLPLMMLSIFAAGQTNTQTITATGAGTFNVPAGVNQITIEVWGGGGGGGNSNNGAGNGGGGGGGGAYSRKTFTGSLPASFNYFVGAGGTGAPGSSTTDATPGGDSWFDSNTSLMAKGGAKGNDDINGAGSQGLGGASADGFGDVKFSGGNGANATASVGAAGGGSAGSASNGNNASGTGTTAAVTEGGTGGSGGGSGNTVANGGNPGGGGGGANDVATEAGGNGGNGQIRITYTLPTVLTIVRLTPVSATTKATTVTFRVTFSENVSGVSADGSDFALSFTGTAAGTINTVTEQVASTVFDVQVTGVAGTGNLNLDFGAHNITSTSSGNAFNGVIGTEEQYAIDNTPPTASAPISTAQRLKSGAVSTSTVQSTEAGAIYLILNGEAAATQADITTAIGANKAFAGQASAAANTPYTVTVAASLVDGVYDIVAVDALGNVSAIVPGWLTVDNTAPTVTINQGGAQADPAGSLPVTFDIVFSEAVTGFTSGDINLADGTATVPSVSGLSSADGGITWTLTVSVVDLDGGTIVPKILASVCTDLAGNNNMASTSTDNSVTYSPAPSVTVNQAVAQSDPTNSTSMSFTAVFSKAIDPTTFTSGDITIAGTATGATAGAPTTSDNITWNIPISGLTGAGTVIVSIDAGRVQDALGNNNLASTSTDNTVTFDNVAPVIDAVTSNATGAGTLKIGDQINFTVDIATASAQTGLTISPTTYNGGTLTWSTSDGGETYVAAYTVVSGHSDQLAALQLTNVTATDPATNVSAPVSGSDVVKTIDANNPPAFTTGTLTTTGGTVVAGYWNSSNTGMNVAVPVTADVGGQFSLNGGTIQIQGRRGADAFVNIAGASVAIGPADPGTTKTVSLTDTQFESVSGFADGQTVQLRAVITDAAGNLTTGGTSATSIIVDQTAPSSGTVGGITATGGRAVLLYYNSTNTGLNVIVPVSNSDASLDNGSVQVRIMMTGGSFTAVGGIPAPISNPERTGGSKTVAITAANLEGTAGFSDGNVSGLRAAETKFLIVTARVTDVAGNFVDYTQSNTLLDVDQTPPAPVSNLFTLYANAGSGGRDAIQFVSTEVLSDHAASPVERVHDFPFIAASNTYGSGGISVGGGTTVGATDDVRYFNNGAVNALDGGLTNTRVVYIESAANSATWGAAAGTKVQYVQLGTASTAASVLRDPAGNEMAAFDLAVNTGTSTTLAAATSGIAVSPLVNSATDRVVFAFSLTASGALNLTSLSIAATSDPSLVMGSYRLYSTTGADNFAAATNTGLTATLTTTSVDFNSITVPLSATTTYFYLVANVNPYFYSASPQIQFSLPATSLPNAGGGFNVSTGGYGGTTVTGTNYSFTDNTQASIVSITNVVDPINLGNLVQSVKIQFNEPMNPATSASGTSIDITPFQGNWNYMGGSWSTTALTNDTYTATFQHNGSNQTNFGNISTINSSSGLQDWGGFANHGSATSSGFVVDTRRPFVSSITRSLSTVNLSNNTIRISVRYDESMNTSVAPNITFSNGTWGAAVPVTGAGYTNGWRTTALTNDTYEADFTNSTTNEDFATVTASANAAQDANLNNQTSSATSASFILDTQRPTVVSINRGSPAQQLTNSASVSYTVIFSEAVSADATDFVPVAINGTVTTGSVTSVTTLNNITFTVTVGPISGDGDIRLDVNGGSATINDFRGNALNTGRTGDQIYTIDRTAPKLTSLALNPTLIDGYSSAVNGFTPSLHANTIEYTFTFSEPVVNFNFGGYLDGNFTGAVPADAGYPLLTINPGSITPPSGASATWTVTGTYIPGAGSVATTGRFQLDYDNSLNNETSSPGMVVRDQAGNSVANNDNSNNPNPVFTGPYYNVALEEPTASVSGFTTSSNATGTALTVNWADVVTTNTTTPTHYLVILSTSATPPAIADGTYNADNDDLGDGLMFHNVAKGIQTTTFNGLTDGTDYTVFIYSYTLSPNNIISSNRSVINYRTTSPTTVSRTSDIVRDGAFAYTSNIPYINYQTSALGASGIIGGVESIVLERFKIRDGGSTLTDADNLGTTLGSITFDITNYANLGRLAIYDGVNEILEIDLTAAGVVTVLDPTTGRVTFSGLSGLSAAETTEKVFSLRATFRGTGVVDNQAISFKVHSVTASALVASSQFKSTIVTGVQSSLASDQNRIEVTATKIDFTTVPISTSVSVPITVEVQASDLHNNLDLDFVGTITATGNTPVVMGNVFTTTNDPTGTFAAGVKAYPGTFQFASGNGDVRLTITAGGISGTSPIISVITAFESVLISTNDFSATTADIDYVDYQSTDIVNTSTTTSNAFMLDFMYLADGGLDLSDVDSAPTILDNLTLGVSNPQSIRRIAIYTQDISNGVLTEIQELDSTDPNFTVSNGYGQVAFTNLNIPAPDGSYAQILVLATFASSAATITDRDYVQVAVLSASLDPGSKFAPDEAQTGTIGGMTITSFPFPEASASVNVGAKGIVNRIQVTATSLDFVTQPSAIAGKNEPIDGSAGTSPGGSTGIVHARDRYAVIDTDFTGAASATTINAAAGAVDYPPTFTNGVLDLTGMTYNLAGDGTLTVMAAGLNSDAGLDDTEGNSIPCSTVDVIHVTAADDQTNGVDLQESLKGGTGNKRIFGVRFYAEHDTPAAPSLESFSIVFRDLSDNTNVPYPYTTGATTIYKNFRLYMAIGSGSASPLAAGTDYTLVETQSPDLADDPAPSTYKDKLVFTLTNPVPLYENDYRFYLEVDIDVSVNVGTNPITPFVADFGYAVPAWNDHINTTTGSSTALVQGITRRFASTKPPLLVYTNPASGTLNVDPDLSQITLKFDVPVVTFDGQIKLYNRETGSLVATLLATSGVYDPNQPLKSQVVSALNFAVPPGTIKLDTVYYVTIEKGVYSVTDATQRKGISDESFNLFGGISYNGTFYFKGSSPNAPVLSATDATKYYYTESSASFNFVFDQAGTVHYMVVSSSGAPGTVTKEQIRGTALYASSTIIKRDSVTIDQFKPNFQFATINAQLVAGQTYYVYAYAKNDARPTPVATTQPYGSAANAFAVGAAGPTLTLTPSNIKQLNQPNIEICATSAVKVEEPIIVSESSSSPSSFGGAGDQTFLIYLPTGFQFETDSIPTVTFNGAGWQALAAGSDTVTFLNTTLMQITFRNSGNTSIDNLVISDLYLIASSAGLTGDIRRFVTGNPAVDIKLASVTSAPATSISFTNSYEIFNGFQNDPEYTGVPVGNDPEWVEKPVTYIPNNFSAAVKLIPDPPNGDYGASYFSGSGVTDDQLTLSAAPLDAAFNIVLSHTDPNGCNTTKTEQYQVYDYRNAIPELFPGRLAGNLSTKVALVPGIPDPVTNIPGKPSPTLVVSDSVSFLGKAGYQMLELYADIPAHTLTTGQLLDRNQTGWQTLVDKIPHLSVGGIKAGLHPNTLVGETFKTFNWEYAGLIDPDSAAARGVTYVFDPGYARSIELESRPGIFKQYFQARSLGLIEFTGLYQSTADFSVFIPFRQQVELFVPAIPLVDASLPSAYTGVNEDTLVYCQNGPGIVLNGFPKATAGISSGTFRFYDAASNVDITASMSYTDNGAGTVVLAPNASANSYKSIRVEYTYQELTSPAIGTGSLHIRITPNPQPNFTTTALCEEVDVTFMDATTFNGGSSEYSVISWAWSFGDANSPANTSNLPSPIHVYENPGLYNSVSLSVISNYNCPAVAPNVKSLQVMAKPGVKFSFGGVSTADNFVFQADDASGQTTKSGLDSFAAFEWYFGDATTFTDDTLDNVAPSPTVIYTKPSKYLNPGPYEVKLIVRTKGGYVDIGGIRDYPTVNVGCVDSLKKTLIVLPEGPPIAAGSTYEENFQSVTGGDWQVLSENGLNSWRLKSVPEGTSQVWITNDAGTYSAKEKSSLFSPSFNFTAAVRPMISFKSLSRLDGNSGIVLMYSTDTLNVVDPLKEWSRLGNVGTGVDWYNKLAIASQPGGLDNVGAIGWTDTIAGPAWQDARHALAEVVEEKKVVFRFAFAANDNFVPPSTGPNPYIGFAIDSVRVGERTRIVLLENFSNLGNANSVGGQILEKRESDYLKQPSSVFAGGIGTDLAKIVYHTGFPGTDPLNTMNTADPGARALFYNIEETPIARLDGYYSTNPLQKYFSQWGLAAYNTRSLQLAQADIQVNVTGPDADGAYEISADVTAVANLPSTARLFVAVVEGNVPIAGVNGALVKTTETDFEWVLRKMLPSGLGEKFDDELLQGLSTSFGPYTWTANGLYTPGNDPARAQDLAVVAFLQDEMTKEIYQTAIRMNLTEPSTVTGILGPETESFRVFPNPTADHFNVVIPTAAADDVPVKLIDSFGRAVHMSTIGKGARQTVIPTESVAGGVYFIELFTADGPVRKKVMVVR